MLFHIEQTHAPADCPYGAGGSHSLFDANAEGVKLLGFWLSFPQHTTYLLVEAEDATSLNTFLKPGAKTCLAEITPVVDKMVP